MSVIWLASYPKSGNTWIRAFLHNLLTNAKEPASINHLDQFCKGESDIRYYAPYIAHVQNEEERNKATASIRIKVQASMVANQTSSMFVKTHNRLGLWLGFPLHNMEITAGAIYVVRHPLDVALSMSHFFQKDLGFCLTMMGNENAQTAWSSGHIPEIYGAWPTHVTSWTAHPNEKLHIVRYEDMLERPQQTFGGIASFLGLNPPAERLERAISFSSFASLQAQEQSTAFIEKPRGVHAFFRQGKACQWKENQAVTPQHKQMVLDICGEVMAQFHYGL